MLRQPHEFPTNDSQPPVFRTPSTSRAVWLLFSSSLMLAILGLSLVLIVYFQGGLGPTPVVADRMPISRGALLRSEQITIDLFEKTSPSVVHITSIAQQYRGSMLRRNVEVGTGSGFVWDAAGHIVTNYHVILGGGRRLERGQHVAWITFGRDSTKRYKGLLVGTARYKDLAVLRVEAPAELLRPLDLGTSADLKVGQKVLAIGNPFGLDQTLTTGVISALGREIESVSRTTINDVVQTDAAINPGNSGGPLFDSAGRLVGVNTAIYSPSGAYAGIGFAIPVDTVVRVIPSLIKKGELLGPVLGIKPHPEFDRRLRLPGVMVWGVDPGSGAERAGLVAAQFGDRGNNLELGDLIVGVEDREVKSLADLESVLQDFQPGDRVKVDLLRKVKVYRNGRIEGKREQIEIGLSPRG